MKCLYYVAPELDSTSRIADDLHDVGIDDFFVHVIAKDESGLKKRHIHAGNYLETLDFIREGFLGAAIGLFAGVIGCILLDQFGPFGNIPWYVYVALCGVATLFGAWEGGLIGVEKENKKLERFHDDIEAGRFLDPDLRAPRPGVGGPAHDDAAPSRGRVRGRRQPFRKPVHDRQAAADIRRSGARLTQGVPRWRSQ